MSTKSPASVGDTYMLTGGIYNGVVAQVIVDKEWEVEDCSDIPTDDDLTELTYDWYVQDDFQNIWYLGEASRDFGEDCPSVLEVPLGTPRGSWPDDDLFLECTGGLLGSGPARPGGR